MSGVTRVYRRETHYPTICTAGRFEHIVQIECEELSGEQRGEEICIIAHLSDPQNVTNWHGSYRVMDREKGEGEKRRAGEGKRASAAVCCESVLALETRGRKERRVESATAGCVTGSLVPCPTSRLCVSRTIAGGPSCFMPRTMILRAPTPSAYAVPQCRERASRNTAPALRYISR